MRDRLKRLARAAAFLLASPALGVQPDPVQTSVPTAPPVVTDVARGYIDQSVPVSGVVVPSDVFRLKATIDGRMESVSASSWTWVKGDTVLGLLANTELAALIDARGTTPQEMLEDRWQRVFAPSKITCGAECFILQVFIKEKRPIRPEQVLFEVSKGLLLVAKVRPHEAGWVRPGMAIEAWVGNRRRVVRAYIDRIIPPKSRDSGEPTTVEAPLSPEGYLNPGTKFEGRVIIEAHEDTLYVPTQSLIRHKDGVYLPVRVKTGLVSETHTEVLDTVVDRQPILVLDPKDLRGAERGRRDTMTPPAPKPAAPKPEPERKRKKEFEDEVPSDLPEDQ
ncbi:MAG: hypothetical protein HY059_09050 [Proteobacteria bacterium]|nr:hypothetical protein [Pseudomonadota bacterium]